MNGKGKRQATVNMHYVPSFILRKFAPSGPSRQRALWIYDKLEKRWSEKPRPCKELAFIPDLYSLKDVNPDAQAFENLLGDFENRAAPLIESIIKNKVIPNYQDDAYAELICFIALLFIRTPLIRDSFAMPFEQVAEDYYKIERVLHERNQRQAKETPSEGWKSNIPSHIFNSFEEHGERKFKMTQRQLLLNMPLMLQTLVPILLDLHWSISIMKEEGCGFICSDSPVVRHTAHHYLFPISIDTSLLASKEGPSCSFYVERIKVGWANRMVADAAYRYVFTGNRDFPILTGELKSPEKWAENRLVPIGKYFQ